jgi:hypothetical protein
LIELKYIVTCFLYLFDLATLSSLFSILTHCGDAGCEGQALLLGSCDNGPSVLSACEVRPPAAPRDREVRPVAAARDGEGEVTARCVLPRVRR